MKNILIAITLLMPVAGMGQSKIITELKAQFSGNEEVTSFSFGGNFLNMASWFNSDNKEEEAVKNLINGIDHLQILSIPIGKKGIREIELRELRKNINKDHFEDLMVIRDENEEINIMVKEKGGMIVNVLMVVNDNKALTLLDFSGSISREDVALLTENVNFN